jgi:uncharacterized protein
MNIHETIASQLSIQLPQVLAAVKLLDEGATVPFISRYRKEVTGGLSDTELRNLEQSLTYLREMEDRRQTIITSITEQGKLTPELAQAINAADNKASLEDLYLPYKPKRRTKAQIAREAGLEPLALGLLADPTQDPLTVAAGYLNAEHSITEPAQALDGARQILMEQFAEHAGILAELRETVWQQGILTSQVQPGKEEPGKKFLDYFAYEEALKKIPSHRALALFRGRKEEILRVQLTLTDDVHAHCRLIIANTFNVRNQSRPADAWLEETVAWTWKIKLFTKLELELMSQLREYADEEAIKVFANNLKNLLMQAPAGSRVTLGLDPGIRTGVKAVVIDGTGKLLSYATVFPHEPRREWKQSLTHLAELCRQHKVDLVSIGNGTASRETDQLVAELMKAHPELNLTRITISEAGASIYSASELAAKEFPELDVTYRGAVSIARRLQDPLAELVKIEPKAIGVGQYQHDVNQTRLTQSLDAVIEDCVNSVGVDLNTASAPLLASVAGLNQNLATQIIGFRDQNGPFKNREQLKLVPRLGAKTYEQAAGFLRIINGDNPLDRSAVHPEAYPVVEKILSTLKQDLPSVMGNPALLTAVNAADFTNEQFGLPTVTDIISELRKPGRDPRPEFKTPKFNDEIHKLSDLKPGMILEGVVTNVANFGAFVDIGVHQDGLVHKSEMAHRFVADPSEVVKVGQIVKVRVLTVDLSRNRIQLSLRLEDKPAQKAEARPTRSAHIPVKKQPRVEPTANAAMALAFAGLKEKLAK